MSKWRCVAWSRLAVDVPNGGLTQFFYNHRGELGIKPLCKLLKTVGVAKPVKSLEPAVAVYRKHRERFKVENPWEGLFGGIPEFCATGQGIYEFRAGYGQ